MVAFPRVQNFNDHVGTGHLQGVNGKQSNQYSYSDTDVVAVHHKPSTRKQEARWPSSSMSDISENDKDPNSIPR